MTFRIFLIDTIAEKLPLELIQAISNMLTNAIRNSTTALGENNTELTQQYRPSPFTMNAYRTVDATPIQDYFTHFTWALELSRIAQE